MWRCNMGIIKESEILLFQFLYGFHYQTNSQELIPTSIKI